MGASVNIITGFLISRVKVRTLAVVSALISMVAAPLMATGAVGQNYWFSPFWALFLSPASADGKKLLFCHQLSCFHRFQDKLPIQVIEANILSQFCSQSPISSYQTHTPPSCSLSQAVSSTRCLSLEIPLD